MLIEDRIRRLADNIVKELNQLKKNGDSFRKDIYEMMTIYETLKKADDASLSLRKENKNAAFKRAINEHDQNTMMGRFHVKILKSERDVNQFVDKVDESIHDMIRLMAALTEFVRRGIEAIPEQKDKHSQWVVSTLKKIVRPDQTAESLILKRIKKELAGLKKEANRLKKEIDKMITLCKKLKEIDDKENAGKNRKPKQAYATLEAEIKDTDKKTSYDHLHTAIFKLEKNVNQFLDTTDSMGRVISKLADAFVAHARKGIKEIPEQKNAPSQFFASTLKKIAAQGNEDKKQEKLSEIDDHPTKQ